MWAVWKPLTRKKIIKWLYALLLSLVGGVIATNLKKKLIKWLSALLLSLVGDVIASNLKKTN